MKRMYVLYPLIFTPNVLEKFSQLYFFLNSFFSMTTKEFSTIIALSPFLIAIPFDNIKESITILRSRNFTHDQIKTIVFNLICEIKFLF